ncbi:MAG TPA: glycosyltransferase [Synergistaceae bacterium]|nr:glycosyltransferase [Synergistaceae bacterium]
MRRISRWKPLFYINLLIIFLVVFYKFYLHFFEENHTGVHADQIEKIELVLEQRESFSFAVVGNIKNSIGVFERKIIPELNRSDVDFIVSAGNAVSGGGEDKYRALHQTLEHLHKPYLLTFGKDEYSTFGGFRYYDHYGPYVFSFSSGDNTFVFLDSSGKTSFQWQIRWLREELGTLSKNNIFVFIGHPLLPVDKKSVFDFDDDYLVDEEFREPLRRLIESAGVTMVFSSNLPLYSFREVRNTAYVVTGGGGGLLLNDERSFYHFVKVRVQGNRVTVEPVRLDIGQHQFFRTIESLWFFVHSLFYVGYLNYLLFVCCLILSAYGFYSLLLKERDYYPNYSVFSELTLDGPIRVAMFSNTYLPVIAGVPISIKRLSTALLQMGHQILVFAPKYEKTSPSSEEREVFRVPCFSRISKKRVIALPNIFSIRIFKKVREFSPQIIHLHHPLWMGSLGLWIARYLKIPVVYTYHTRLEHYSYAVPLPRAFFRNFLSHALIRRIGNKCDAVVVPTEASEYYLRMIRVKSPVFVVPTGIETEKFHEPCSEDVKNRLRQELGIEKGEKVLLSVSRLNAEKNIQFMLEAVSELAKKCSVSFKVILIGDGPDRSPLVETAHALGLEDILVFTGSVSPDRIPMYYSLGDIFVFASTAETQGMVILEAMASGMPVVAIRASGIDDFVVDGVTGFKTIHHVEAWAEKVQLLLEDGALREDLSRQAVSMADRYGVDEFGRRMERVYAHVLTYRKKTGYLEQIRGTAFPKAQERSLPE